MTGHEVLGFFLFTSLGESLLLGLPTFEMHPKDVMFAPRPIQLALPFLHGLGLLSYRELVRLNGGRELLLFAPSPRKIDSRSSERSDGSWLTGGLPLSPTNPVRLFPMTTEAFFRVVQFPHFDVERSLGGDEAVLRLVHLAAS